MYNSARMVLSGEFFECFFYEQDIDKAINEKKEARRNKANIKKNDGEEGNKQSTISRTFEEAYALKERSLKATSLRLRRLVNANNGQYRDENGRIYLTTFLTLTFADNVREVKKANNIFKKFIKRFNYAVYGSKTAKLRYVSVIEFQKRGAIHYHTLFFNLPYISTGKIEAIWGQGFVMINSVKHIGNMGAYLIKYMTKDIEDERLEGEKRFFCSKGLLKPIVMSDPVKIGSILEEVPENHFIYEREINSPFWGPMKYYRFNVINSPIEHLYSLLQSRILTPPTPPVDNSLDKIKQGILQCQQTQLD